MKFLKYQPKGYPPPGRVRRKFIDPSRHGLRGKTMNELAVCGRILGHSPDSDCNSNHPGSTSSCLSNASSQDIDFIQDNSDYQWFLDYNYRDGSTNHHTSILSLSEAYDANELGYYNVLSKNLDANLAEADMESFRTEDIHALLTNLPIMCVDPLSQDSNRQGECYASVTGSMMAKFDFDSSISPHSSSQESANSTSMSICKSELLFSPVKEVNMPGANYSVDSLDCDLMTEHDIMLTCQANKDNYTIAFEGSMITYSEDSDYHDTDKSDSASGTGSTNWASNLKTQTENVKRLESSMAQSDSGGFTTWSTLKKRSSDNQLRRHPSGNNNTSYDTGIRYNHIDNVLKSQSMPNLYKQKMKGLLAGGCLKNQNIVTSLNAPNIKRQPVKVFDILHQLQQSSSLSGGSLISEMATSADAASTSSESNKHHPNFNLVKRFMKHKSMSAEAMDQSSLSENWHSHESLKHSTHDDKANYFEDSLLVDQKNTDANTRTHNLIIEEKDEDITRSESVEQLSESISKLESITESLHNANNNNGSNITYKLKTHSTQTKHNSSATSSSSDSSTQSSFVPRHRKSSPKTASAQIPLQLMNKSMQTSVYLHRNLTNAPYKLNCNNSKDCVKVIEPSFLTKLKTEGDTEKPVYILYPNYVLPDLQFLNDKPEDAAKVFLMPQRTRTSTAKSRPFSCNDVEALKKKGFSHVCDWDSLNFLLPNECRQLLADVPEIAQHIKVKGESMKKPSFCASPPVRRRARPVSCDGGIGTDGTTVSSSSSTATQPSSGYRGSSTMLLTDSQNTQNSPGPTTNFNPLFVYRYDSVTSSEASLMNSDRQRSITTTAPPLPKRSISLSHERARKGELTPPRPPLPKGILRKSIENAKLRKSEKSKRYSMFDMTENDILEEISQKRHSLQEQYYYQRHKRLSETEDEGVDAGTSSSSLDEQPELNTRIPKADILLSNISSDEMVQLEEFLKMSGISSSDPEDLDEEGVIQLRTCVSKFLSLKINQDSGRKSVSFAVPKNFEMKPPNNSPNSSAFTHQRLVDMPICEEGESTPENYSSPVRAKKETYDLNKKRLLISSVTDAIEKIIEHFAPATSEADLMSLGESASCAKIVLGNLCPAIYAVLSDGLKPNLATSFGPISNSVWQVIEASAQQGILTKALNDLVMRINSEDAITEGLVKFNAFIFGLMNVRSLDAWVSYLRTRESILKKHYNPDAFLLLAHTGGAVIRELLDTLVSALEPLALLPFHFDLLFEYRQLHNSLKRMDSYKQPPSPTYKLPTSPNHLTFKQWNVIKSGHSVQSNSDTEEPTVRQCLPDDTVDPSLPDLLNSSASTKFHHKPDKLRPRSCVEPKANFKLGEDVASMAKRRWSGISQNSKLYQAYDRLGHDDAEEEYTDSLENNCMQQPESLDSNVSDDKPLNGARFKKLQQKWEMLSGKELSTSPPLSPSHLSKSKIPRLVTSPLKPSGIPIPIVSPTGSKTLSKQNSVKRVIPVVKNNSSKKTNVHLIRTSRLDQLDTNGDAPKHVPRPSSLPYKPISMQQKCNRIIPPRRAVSSSIGRKPVTQNQTHRMVRTLSHRLPSESGHLSYNEGECLKVILEVDDKWLLCCRGTQKGLVPRSAVIVENGRF